MKSVRPCTARLIEVRIELVESNDITSDPHYIPECTEDGKAWRVSSNERTVTIMHKRATDLIRMLGML